MHARTTGKWLLAFVHGGEAAAGATVWTHEQPLAASALREGRRPRLSSPSTSKLGRHRTKRIPELDLDTGWA